MRSAQTPVALTTLSAATSNRSPLAASTQATPGGPARSSSRTDHLGAVGEDGAEALGLAEHGQHEADVVGLAVVEEVGLAGVASGERRDQLGHLLAGDRAMAVRRPVVLRADRATPRAAGALPRLALAAPLTDPRRRHHVVHVQPDPDRAGCGGPRRGSGTRKGVG